MIANTVGVSSVCRSLLNVQSIVNRIFLLPSVKAQQEKEYYVKNIKLFPQFSSSCVFPAR